ncbi:unnamed protein product [Effrenium voratum]|nr:unnamed protein product [Effrenium voratum]
MLKAFEEPWKVLFSQYAKPRRGATGKRLEMRLEVLESLLADLDLLGRIQKRQVPALFKSALPKPTEEALLVENFLTLVPRLAKFFPPETVPMTDFGVSVAPEAGQQELCTLLRHLETLADTSHNSSLRVARPVLARAKRRWVLAYAKKVLREANAQLMAEDPDEIDLPDGFAIGVRQPPKVHLVPAGLPISQAERISAEILDELLAKAVGLHFLEDASSGGPRPMAFVKGHEDLSVLEPREDAQEARAEDSTGGLDGETCSKISEPAQSSLEEMRGPGRSQLFGGDANASRSNPPKAREEEVSRQREARSRDRGRAQSSQPPARTVKVDEANAAPAAAAASVPLGQLSPAQAEAAKRQRRLHRHHTFAEEGKARQEALQAALGAEPVQRLFKAWEPNFRRSYDFFQRWKPSSSGEMTLAGFLLLGDCFGILEKDDLKVAFKRGAGHELSLADMPNVLMHCVARSVEVECQVLGVPDEGPVTDPEVLSQAYENLCRHMMLNNGRTLGKCLDSYRRAGQVLDPFTVQLPEKYTEVEEAKEDAGAASAEAPAEAGEPPAPEVPAEGSPQAPAEAKGLEAKGDEKGEAAGEPKEGAHAAEPGAAPAEPEAPAPGVEAKEGPSAGTEPSAEGAGASAAEAAAPKASAPEGSAEPTEPAAAEPTAAEPTAAEPTAAEPTAAEPTAAEPAAAEPAAAEPAAAVAEVVQASKQTLPEASEASGPLGSFHSQSSAEKDSPTHSKLDKFSRSESQAHLEADEELLRGIPLHHTLRVGLGRWNCPNKMSRRKQEALYEKSSPTLYFDIFFSHTWLTKGNRKYAALLFHNGWFANPKGKITIAPLFVESVVLTLHVGILACSTAIWVGEALPSRVEYTVLHILPTAIVSALPLWGIIHVLRKETRAKRQLLFDLESFSLDRAECVSEFDRAFIHSAIDKWYGSAEAFAEYVRGPLRAELLQSNAATVPSAYLMTCVIGLEAMHVELLLALVKGGAPLKCILTVVTGRMVGAVVYQLACLKLMLKLAEKFAEPCNAILDLLQTFLIWLTTAFLLMSCGFATVTLQSRPNVLPLLLLVFFECLVFLAAFGHLPLRRVCLRSSERT